MTLAEIKSEYPFLYETHMHTYEGSACGNCHGEDMAKCYFEHGYTGIIITDHNWGGNTRPDRALNFEKWVDAFFEGYDRAKEWGDKNGLQVFCGWEAGYGGPEFLIYGPSPEDLKAHPELWTATIPEQLKIIHNLGGMVIQAHPYREAYYITNLRTYPEYCDGLEALNASHSHDGKARSPKERFNKKAFELAAKYNLPITAGSDQHNTTALMGGMAFKTKLTDIRDFCDRVLHDGDYVVTNGFDWFTKTGEFICKCE